MSINWLLLIWTPADRNKFEFLVEFVRGKFDTLMISKTNIYKSFSLSEVDIDGFQTSFGLDCNSTDGGYYDFCLGRYTGKTDTLSKKAKLFLKLFF